MHDEFPVFLYGADIVAAKLIVHIKHLAFERGEVKRDLQQARNAHQLRKGQSCLVADLIGAKKLQTERLELHDELDSALGSSSELDGPVENHEKALVHFILRDNTHVPLERSQHLLFFCKDGFLRVLSMAQRVHAEVHLEATGF